MKKRRQDTYPQADAIPQRAADSRQLRPCKALRPLLTAAILAASLAVTGILGGCGAGSKSASSADFAAAEAEAPMEMAETAAAAEMPEMAAVHFGSGAEPEGALQEEAGTVQNSAANPTGNPDASAEDTAPAQRKLIRNMHMSVETDDFDALISGITRRIGDLGGYIEQSDISGQQTNYRNEPIPRSAFLTARIPSAKLDSFADSVAKDGNVTNKSESTQDVTLQYSDTLSRKKSLTIEQDRIWALLEKADTLESVIALEKRLSEIRYELESMESQLRLYDNQVDYSTVTLDISEVKVYTPTAPETVGQRIRSGFNESLENVADFCVSLFVGVAASSPVWVPILILMAAALLIYKKKKVAKKP